MTKQCRMQVGYEKYDIVTANILADVLVPLTPVIIASDEKRRVSTLHPASLMIRKKTCS